MSDPSVPVATPPIIFYVPEYPEDRSLPGTEIAPWLRQWVDLVGTAAIHGKGQMAWTLHTFICLRERGLACRLTREIPERGIIIAHRDAFPAALRPSRRQLFVCLKADRRQHPFAQVHVVANSSDMSGRNLSFADRLLFPGQRHFLPHWQQPGLRPRSPARGDRFENTAFVGHPWNLAPELRDAAWKERLRALGLNWRMVPPEEWNDFNDIDVIVAIRSFSKTDFFWKPAQKLYNAWAAG
ncbi:MAG: hypothetical protein LJE84_14260, partial [Gammaproteobacteria bacterium]|nr:hypothetical protein [Gammaproteobacteria bacterium]